MFNGAVGAGGGVAGVGVADVDVLVVVVVVAVAVGGGWVGADAESAVSQTSPGRTVEISRRIRSHARRVWRAALSAAIRWSRCSASSAFTGACGGGAGRGGGPLPRTCRGGLRTFPVRRARHVTA